MIAFGAFPRRSLRSTPEVARAYQEVLAVVHVWSDAEGDHAEIERIDP